MEIELSALAAAVAEEQFTGVVAVDVADEPGERHCYGFANRAFGVPNGPETRFALASGSKTFTALGILRLVDAGRLELSSPVRPILGADLPLIDDAVTVEQLLAHTSGIGDYLDESDDWDASDYVLPVPVHTLATTSGFLPLLDGHPQAFPPGERFAYCNGGYVVLALVIERVSEPFWYGLGVYVDPDSGVLAMEGYDAGVSMRSLHDPAAATTASVLGNTPDGSWPIAELLLEAITSR